MTSRSQNSKSLLDSSCIVFWDFDGVIKDTMEVKGCAYERLFLPYGNEVARRVRKHHEGNGGVSRFDKIPLYLSWAGEVAMPEQVQAFCDRFSQVVLQAVIDSPWVPGVREYLLRHCYERYFVLLTAVPQEEIERILTTLEISHCFSEVHGAPTEKGSAIGAVLVRQKCKAEHALMIGDTEQDYQAAQLNLVPFILRRTPFNLSTQARYDVPMFFDLNDE